MPQAIVLSHDDPAKVDERLIGLEPLPTTTSPNKGNSSFFDFLYQRSTYYWITIIVNLCQVGLCTAGIALALARNELTVKDKKRGYTGDIFIISGSYSIIIFILSVLTLYYHYKKGSDVGPNPYNAGRHYDMTAGAVVINFIPLYILLALDPAFRSKIEPCTDNIRPILYQLIIGFTVTSAFSNIIAARITSQSAKRARGVEMVHDPNYRIPTWTLATTEECQGLSGGAIRL